MTEEEARATEDHHCGAAPQDELSRNRKADDLIKLSPFARYLDELCITADPELLLDSYVDFRDSHGLRGEVLLNTLTNTFPELREALAMEADRKGFLERCEGYSRTTKKTKKAKKTESGDMLIFKPSVEDGGKLYEEIYQDGQALFIDAEGIMHETVDLDGIKYAPLSGDELIEGAVLLPSGLEEYEQEKALIEQLRAHIHRYVDVSPFFETISAYYILLTWLYDELNTLPYLRALGDTGTGKSRFLDVVGRLCYKATMVAGAITPAPIYRLLRKWHGTIIIDEGDFRQSDEMNEVVKILNCGFERGRPVVRCMMDRPDDLQILATFGPKIISSRRRFRDVALESRCITEIMRETSRENVPYMLPPTFYEEEKQLRNKLLAFRFRNRGKVDQAKVQLLDEVNVENRLKQTTASFAVLLAHNPQVFREFTAFLTAYNAELVEERSETVEGGIISALHELVKSASPSVPDVPDVPDVHGDEFITVSDVCSLYHTKLGYELDPRTAGKIIKTLGFTSVLKKTTSGKKERVLVIDHQHLKRLKKKYLPPESEGESENGNNGNKWNKGNDTKGGRNVCDGCGDNRFTTLHKGRLLCDDCLSLEIESAAVQARNATTFSTEENGPEDNGAGSVEIEDSLGHSEYITSPPESLVPLAEQSQAKGAPIVMAEVVHRESSPNAELQELIIAQVHKYADIDPTGANLDVLAIRIPKDHPKYSTGRVLSAITVLLEDGTLTKEMTKYGPYLKLVPDDSLTSMPRESAEDGEVVA